MEKKRLVGASGGLSSNTEGKKWKQHFYVAFQVFRGFGFQCLVLVMTFRFYGI